MRIGIMQPYFFPYLGYFSLISLSEKFILFDELQFIRHGWIERNRIVGPQYEPVYIKVPLVKHSRNTLIKDVEIVSNGKWQEKIFAQLTHYKKKAPYYYQVKELLEDTLYFDSESISLLNMHCIKSVCSFIGLNDTICSFSDLNFETPVVREPDEWALEISKLIKAKEYINPIGGLSFFNKEKYASAGIKLKFIENKLVEYKQISPNFQPAMSIIDVLMFNNPTEAVDLINEYKIVK